MEFSTTTEKEPASGEEQIRSLLSQDLPQGQPGETTSQGDVPEDTSVADVDVAEEKEAETPVEETEEAGDTESEEEAGPDEGAEGEAEDFAVSEADRDFSSAAYARAAAHYEKNYGIKLDPGDEAHRRLLRELIDRGQRIRELQAEREAPEEKPVEQPQAAAPAVLTPEQRVAAARQRLSEAREYAKGAVVPEVAMEFAKDFVDALWYGREGDKKVSAQIKQEQATALTQVFTTFGAMLVADAVPSIMASVPQAVSSDPVMSRVRDMAVREQAIDELMAEEVNGRPAYPNLERLIESGTIKRLMNSAELKEAVFVKDPYKNLLARVRFAYKLASNQPVDPAALGKAAARGRAAERERQQRVAAGRTPPGSSAGSSAPSSANNFMNRLLSMGNGSKFSRALKEGRRTG